MSALAQELVAIAKQRELKTLVIDVERLKGRFVWGDRFDSLTIAGEFWSLSDYKHKFGRIPYQYVTEWPRTITASWRWFGEKRINFAAEWETGGAYKFAETVRNVMDEADIVTGHYVNAADRKWLNSLFRDHGLRMPSPYRVVDTCTIARRNLGDESMTLGALCSRYGIPTKQGHYDATVARNACEGDKKAQRELKLYNMADVEASTGLYAVTLPFAKGHPHVRPLAGLDKTLCPRCGSDKVKRDGQYSPSVRVYAQFLCTTCTGWFYTTYESRGPSVRAL
jgi:hypothetical protein